MPPNLSRFLISLAAVAAVVAIWSGLWFYGANRANAAFDAQLEKERQRGRVWTCPERATGGFPIAIQISCRLPTVESNSGGRKTVARFAGLVGGGSLLRPLEGVLTLTSPLDIGDAPDNNLHAEWRRLEISVSGIWGDANSFVVQIDQPSLVTPAAGDAGKAKADSVRLAVTPAPTSAPEGKAYAIQFDMRQLAAPALDKGAKSTEPADVSVLTSIDKIALNPAQDFRERLDAWRRNGGKIDLTQFSVIKGKSKLSASGGFSLDVAHRLEGDLSIEAVGFEEVASAAGVPASMTRLGGLLGNLLPGAKPPAPNADPKALRLQLKLRDGLVFLGPAPIPRLVLPPLY